MMNLIKNKIATLTLFTACLLVFSPSVNAQKVNDKKQKKTKVVENGANDREYWSQLLYKMSYPVIHNLAQETLRKNMPLEQLPDYGKMYGMVASEVSYLEAVGRTMAGVAPWLALPDDNTKEGAMRKELRTELLQGIAHAVDPNSKDYLNFSKQQQPIVDAAYMAHAFIRAPKALWEPLDSLTKKRVIYEFKSLRNRKATFNNWLLFSGITEGFLLKVGADYDPVRIDYAIRKTTEWYSGDGWYSDGPKLCVDYYNSFAIHPMMVDLLGEVTEKKLNPYTQEDYDLAVKRMGRYSEFLERMISPDGTFPVFGRSMAYRTGAFHALAQSALMGKLNNITPAQVRCGLTAVMHRMYDQCDNFDKDGWLILGFCGSQTSIVDVYTSTGSLYMATLAFLPLGLPADNPFWTDAPEDWTSKKAWSGKPIQKDYKVSY